jgi:hypothetical protein
MNTKPTFYCFSVETVPGIREECVRESSGQGNSRVIYLICCKNFCKCYSVPTQHNNKKIVVTYYNLLLNIFEFSLQFKTYLKSLYRLYYEV